MQGPKCKIQGPKWKMQGPKWKMQDQKNPHTAAIILAPPLFFSSIPPTVLVFPTLYRRHERAKRPTTHYLKYDEVITSSYLNSYNFHVFLSTAGD
ncbi:hypothetical protein HanXRQr2_Chr14g0641861 [Helianthus annuus]|uniref:Uncharacterized protein n=1 Tax=Helianthus annuus TaxID=4232 RepID=A0A251SHI2_HELAN|nr:hypothetical protein HanXRQr2_Chr14g0641861 [Helianthus annuus]